MSLPFLKSARAFLIEGKGIGITQHKQYENAKNTTATQ
jgi:hypothetical protein